MMLMASMEMNIEVPVYPERVYRAWLDGAEQRRITGHDAFVQPWVGGEFRGWDGKVRGIFLTLIPHTLIRQTWVLPDFSLDEPSTLELHLAPTCTGCELRIRHQGVPISLTRNVMVWWEGAYLRPLRVYFDALVGDYVADMSDG